MRLLYKYRYVNINKLLNYSFLIIGFILSCVNLWLLSVWTLLVFIRGILKSDDGIIDFFIWIQLRSLINPGIAPVYSGYASLIKWITIFVSSIFILVFKKQNYKKSFEYVYISFILFGIYVIISGFVVSSYPIILSLKLLSYIIPFLAILKCISSMNYGIINKVIVPLGMMIFTSLILVNSPIGYLRNGIGFQGVFNHPNVCGIMLTLFLAGYLYNSSRLNCKVIIISVIVVSIAIITKSRTGIFSCLSCILLFLLSKDTKKNTSQFTYFLLILFLLIISLIFKNLLIDFAKSIVFKGGYDSIIYSRSDQFKSNIYRFFESPLIGTGFNVPYIPHLRSYSIVFDMSVENGNLILSLLADIGLVGFVLFFYSYIGILKLGWGNKILLYVISFLVSMGEQSFFSTNNFGIIIYIYLSIYVADGLRIKNNL